MTRNWNFCWVFSSTVDIVFDAEPSASVRPSLRLSTLFKSNRLPQFSSGLADIWLECTQHYFPQTCGIGILVFFNAKFFLLIFNYRKYVKIGILEVFFYQFLKKFLNVVPWNLVYRHSVDTFKCVWKIAPVGHIFGLFMTLNSAKIGQNVGFRLSSWRVSTGFTFTRNLIFKPIAATFGGVKRKTPEFQIAVSF